MISLCRYLTGVVVHKSHMCVLGGVGTNIVKRNGIAQDPGAKYVVAHAQGEGFGWNNEYYEFDMESGKIFTDFYLEGYVYTCMHIHQ